jgi:DNA repair ATPase RecN
MAKKVTFEEYIDILTNHARKDWMCDEEFEQHKNMLLNNEDIKRNFNNIIENTSSDYTVDKCKEHIKYMHEMLKNMPKMDISLDYVLDELKDELSDVIDDVDAHISELKNDPTVQSNFDELINSISIPITEMNKDIFINLLKDNLKDLIRQKRIIDNAHLN